MCSTEEREMAQRRVRTVLPHGKVFLAPRSVPAPGRRFVDGGPQRRKRAHQRSGSWGGQWSFLDQVDFAVPCVEWRNVEGIGD